MTAETDSSTPDRTLSTFVRNLFSVRTLLPAAAGILAGYSIAVLGKDAVVVPFVGSAPGTLVGAVGLVVALTAYRRWSCCDGCGNRTCGCTNECADSCS